MSENDLFVDRSEKPVVKPADRVPKKRISIYGVIVENNKILLVRSSYAQFWELPGGGQEIGESEFDGLKREMLEEANCEVLKIGEYLGETYSNLYADDIDEYYYNNGKYYIVDGYKIIDKELANEIVENKMFGLENIDLRNIRSDHQEIIKKIIKMNIEIVKARPEDAESWCKIRKVAWLDTYPNEEYDIAKEDILLKDFDSPEKVKKWQESFANPGDKSYYSAKVDGIVVGFSTGNKGSELNEVGAIYIYPQYQGMGIGKLLMNKVLDEFNPQIKTKLNVVKYNERAIKFYEKFGFKIVGPYDDLFGKLPNGKVLPEIEMVREA